MWAGLPVSDLEFIQFHPTMLFDGHAGGRRPLITEAVRGEGAILVDAQGDSVTAGVHPMGDLAPRDVVAAAIDARLAATGDPCVYLDARGIARLRAAVPDRDRGVPGRGHRSDARSRFRWCRARTTAAAAWSPTCTGAPNCAGLFAAGEVARTGMHGANRLASNSLLEGLVVGGRAGAGGRRARRRCRADARASRPNRPRGVRCRGPTCSGR